MALLTKKGLAGEFFRQFVARLAARTVKDYGSSGRLKLWDDRALAADSALNLSVDEAVGQLVNRPAVRANELYHG
jgi:hypothetical protein